MVSLVAEKVKSCSELTAAAVCRKFSAALNAAFHSATPYDYWLLEDALPSEVIASVVALPFAAPVHDAYSGKRDTHNSTRVYFNADNQGIFPVCRAVSDAFKSPELIGLIEEITGAQLETGALRIEYCQDIDGFWLEPHKDISVKLFTMVLYLSDEPELADAGTDIYDDTPDHNLIATAPYKRNGAVIFIPGEKSWHGFSPRPIRGVRKSLIINYVTPDWRAVEELA